MSKVIVVRPPNYPHSHAFDEIAEAFEAALPSDSKQVVFGAHLLPFVGVEDNLSGKIIYQTEQINPNCKWVTDAFISLLRMADEVWDYSPENIKALKSFNINAKFVPVRYMPCMKKFTSLPDEDKDIEVLFYGSTNPRRIAILNDLRAAGVRTSKIFNMYGSDRDAYIARAKIILNIHYFENGIFEIFRCAHLFANSKCVINEKGRDQGLEYLYSPCAKTCDTNDIVKTCVEYLENDALRRAQEAMAFDNFQSPGTAEYF